MKTYLFIVFLLISSSAQTQNVAVKIYENYSNAIVRIQTRNANGTSQGQASGVILKEKGWLITNYHVLGNSATLFAEHNGKEILLDSILAIDTKKDILIIKINSESKNDLKSIPTIKIGNCKNLKVGEDVYAIGSPFGLENTITNGIISGLRSSYDSTQSLIQISAAVSPGSSGGALFNSKGELIGITTMIIAYANAQNLNFAILIDDVLSTPLQVVKEKVEFNKDYNYYFQIGYNDYLKQDYESAIINFLTSSSLDKETDKSYQNYYLGLCYFNLGKYKESKKHLLLSIEKNELSDAYTGLGNVFMEENKMDSAIIYFNKSIELNPDNDEAYLSLGSLYLIKHELKLSLNNLSKAFELNPYNSQTLFFLGALTEEISGPENALSYYLSAVKLSPEFAMGYFAISKCYIKLNETEKAIPYQQKAYELDPTLRIPRK